MSTNPHEVLLLSVSGYNNFEIVREAGTAITEAVMIGVGLAPRET